MEDRPDTEARGSRFREEKVATHLTVLVSVHVGSDGFSTGSAVLTTAATGKYVLAEKV